MRGDRHDCAVPTSKVLSKCSHLCVEKLLAVANSSLRFHSVGLLRSANPPSSEVRVSATQQVRFAPAAEREVSELVLSSFLCSWFF